MNEDNKDNTDNKDIIDDEIICDVCGKIISKKGIVMHNASKFHQDALDKLGRGESEDIESVIKDEIDTHTYFSKMGEWEPEVESTTLVDKLKRFLRRTKSKYEMKLCVFVADGEEPVCKYFPYDPNSQLLIDPDNGEVFLKPMRGNILFYHKHKCLPLCDCPPVDETYDLPEHLALKYYNLGLGEGELAGYKALLEKINKWQFQVTICMFATAIVILGCVYMVKMNAEQVETMQQTVNLLAEMYGK